MCHAECFSPVPRTHPCVFVLLTPSRVIVSFIKYGMINAIGVGLKVNFSECSRPLAPCLRLLCRQRHGANERPHSWRWTPRPTPDPRHSQTRVCKTYGTPARGCNCLF